MMFTIRPGEQYGSARELEDPQGSAASDPEERRPYLDSMNIVEPWSPAHSTRPSTENLNSSSLELGRASTDDTALTHDTGLDDREIALKTNKDGSRSRLDPGKELQDMLEKLSPSEMVMSRGNKRTSPEVVPLESSDTVPSTVPVRDTALISSTNHQATEWARGFLKCGQCRKEHKKCLPRARDWTAGGEKCDRCVRLGFDCGPSVRKKWLPDAEHNLIENFTHTADLAAAAQSRPRETQVESAPALREVLNDLPHIGLGFHPERQTREVHKSKWYDIHKPIFPEQDSPQSPCYESLAPSHTTVREISWRDQEAQGVPSSSKLGPDRIDHPTRFETKDVGTRLHDYPQPYGDTGIEGAQLFAPTDSGYASMHQSKQIHLNSPEHANWETQTVYSAASIETTRKDVIIHGFASQLFDDIGARLFGKLEAATVNRDLPELLADFALRLGQRSSNPEAREAMVFIHRYRSVLCKSLEPLLLTNSEEEDEDSDQRPPGDVMSAEEKIQMWRKNLDYQNEVEPFVDVIEDDLPLEEPEGIQDFNKYAGVVFEDCSYTWLLGKLRNQALLTDEDEDSVMSSIRYEVLRVLLKTTKLRPGCVPIFQTVFEVLWPLRSFLTDSFAITGSVDITQILTITGKACDAQALTCEQYMDQTWPCTGVHLIQLLQQLMNSPSMTRHWYQRPDGATLEVWEADGSKIHVTVKGTSGVAAEVAEQLAWLSAVLRQLPESKGFVISTPSIHCTTVLSNQRVSNLAKSQWTQQLCEVRRDTNPPEAEESLGFAGEPYHFQIRSVIHDADIIPAPGFCWNQMIHQPIIVRGFPIHRRQQKELGLEISLKFAAELVGTKYVNSFDGQLFVKGYSAMLVPTLQVSDVLVWHLYVSRSGQHLSYREHNASSPLDIKIQDIGKFRHIIGWCSRALNYAGAADAHYTVKRARLPKANAGCTLVDNIVSFGVPLTSDAPAILPKQHQTPQARRSGYPNWLRYLHQKFVLFWDERDQKGWLVNGISALLHLIRASLSADRENSAESEFILEPSHLKEPRHPHSAKAPREFLSQRGNLGAKISLTKIGKRTALDKPDDSQDEYETLEDRMDQFCCILEKAITYSEKLQDLSAKSTKGKSAFRLEGWDFVDIVEQVETVHARTTTLSNESDGWLELIRSAGVATFFGQGFDELIRPSGSNCCEDWKILPAGKHYIAANIADIKRIMELKGNPDSKPRYLSETSLWHHPSTAFEGCGCKGPGALSVKLVQQLCSTRKVCICPDLNHADLEIDDYEAGAVIFGYNPEYGPLPDVQTDQEFEDSGLGSSLARTISRSTSSLQPITQDSMVRQYGDANVTGGNARFGDTNVQYIYYNNYGGSPNPAQQSSMPYQQLEDSHQNTGESTRTKRNYIHALTESPSLTELQPQDTSTGSDPGPSKRVKTTATERLIPSWQDVMLA